MPQAAKRFRLGPQYDNAENRPTAHQRGYDKRRWGPLRDSVLMEKKFCEHCLKRGIHKFIWSKERKGLGEVDHIIPSQGTDDPNHWDRSNLQALCKPCHSRKTRSDMQAGSTRMHRMSQHRNR